MKNGFQTESPDKLVQLDIFADSGTLKYQIYWQDELMLDSSEISILPGAQVEIVESVEKHADTTWTPTWGQFDQIRDQYHELILDLNIDGRAGKLFARVYDQGVAFKFELASVSPTDNINFYSEHNLASEDVFYSPAGERSPIGPFEVGEMSQTENEVPKLLVPLVVEKTNHKFLSILESDLFSAKGFNPMRLTFQKDLGKLVSSSKSDLETGKVTTSWKVILLGETAGDLVTNTMSVNLATPCQLDDTDWIKPGKSLWDWRVHGYTSPDGFTYGISTESYKRFIDFASQKGIDYFLIDDSWYTHVSEGHFELSDKLDLDEVIRYAETKGVDLILYYDRKHGEYGDDDLFPYYQSLGMKGIKYGFMGGKVDFSREAIQKSAQSQLLIDFHDGPVPFTGMRRTYPNAITREYCHAQQDSRRAFTPEAFIKMALINAIQGPLDMNNGNFDIIGINSGIREKSPKKTNSYYSTVVAEAARTLIVFSGLVVLPDAPDAYLAKEDLFEFIKNQPVGRWSESHILHSKIGEYITTARRHGEEWFIASAYNQQGGTLDIKLDFLQEDKEYKVTFYEDAEEAHCKTNPEEYVIKEDKVLKDDVIKARMAPGGGHCMWIRPI